MDFVAPSHAHVCSFTISRHLEHIDSAKGISINTCIWAAPKITPRIWKARKGIFSITGQGGFDVTGMG